MLAVVDPRTLLINLMLLLAILLCAVVLFFLFVGGTTGLRLLLWRREQRQAAEDEQRKRFAADGSPLPPTGRGICESCSRAFDEVFHLPGGARRCRTCYTGEKSPAQQHRH